MGGTRFMVQWEEHPSHLATRLGQLLEHQTLVDVTLMCNTHTLRVHRAVLAACSPYFETILQRQLGMYPLIVLKDMQFSVLKSLIEFMYCGETSVTEDNLSALLQAAKFFQVKGLSAMTREALGLAPTAPPRAAPTRTTPANSTINGETARKGFIGRSKRVGVQHTLVSSDAKTDTQIARDAVKAAAARLQATAESEPVFITAPKYVQIRTESQQQRQQQQQQQQQKTDTAQLLLSLSGSEFPKQTFHTVSKNVRFHHNVSTSGAVTVEPSRTCPIESTVIKNKSISKSEVIDRVPVITPNGEVKSATVVLPSTITEKTIEPRSGAETGIGSVKEGVTSQQVFYMDDTTRKRGRPLKRQMNIMFKEKVLTDADMALQKEAEASRKALEMLQQEMSTGDDLAVSSEELKPQKHAASSVGVSKLQTTPLNSTVISSSQRLAKETAVTTKAVPVKADVTQASIVNTSQSAAQNVIYQVAGSAGIDSNNETNIVYQLEGGNLLSQDGSGNIVYQVADNTVMAGEDASEQSMIYQVADSTVSSGEGNSNANVIYQVADGSNNTPLMTQYMEALKEAGLPSDVPILLESGDGSYVSVNEEILMSIMNGGVIQVADGSLVGGENVQFIVQELQELPEGVVEAPPQHQESTAMEVSATNAGETESSAAQEVETMEITGTKALNPESSELKADLPPSVSGDELLMNQTMEEEAILATLEPEEQEMLEVKAEALRTTEDSGHAKQLEEVGDNHSVDDVSATVNTLHATEASRHSNEIITGDSFGQEAMVDFAVMESNVNKDADTSLHYKEDSCDFSKEASTNDFDQENSSEQLDIRAPEKQTKVDTNANAGMSVEQALQAMMGESSDTEMEGCTNASEQQDVKPVISQLDAKSHGTNEASTDDETEDLRLVLSPEDESGKSSLNDSFTLALSSPDSSGNEKMQSEMEACIESSQESQTDKQSPNESEEKVSSDDPKELKSQERGTSELELVLSTDFHPISQQAAESEEAIAEVEDSTEMQPSTKEIGTVDRTASESEMLEADSSMSVEDSTGLALDQTSVSDSDAETIILERQIEWTESIDDNDKPMGNIPEETDTPTACSETDTSSNPISGYNDANINDVYSNAIAGKSLPILTDNDAESIPDNEPIISEQTNSTEDKDCSWLEPPMEPELLGNIKQENTENIASPVPVSEDYSLSSTNPVHSDSSVPKLKSLKIERTEEIESRDKATQPCSTNTMERQHSRLECVRYGLKVKSAHNIDNILVKTIKTSVLDEVMACEKMKLSADQSGIDVKTDYKDGSKVASPVKDIPYAVGLLPLKTALEKLQAMPEHHPRKTRSGSSSKESYEAPIIHLKRKASSSSEGVEKKRKISGGDQADTSSDGGIMLPSLEESDELRNANTSLESVPEDEVNKLIIMSEEPLESHKDKEDLLPSVMDLVNEPNDSL